MSQPPSKLVTVGYALKPVNYSSATHRLYKDCNRTPVAWRASAASPELPLEPLILGVLSWTISDDLGQMERANSLILKA